MLNALGRQDLLPCLEDETGEVQDLVNFLSCLDKTGEVPSGKLSDVQAHLQPAHDAPVVLKMKEALKKERLLMSILMDIKSCKDLVSYMKTSGHSQELEKRLLQEVETRWNSVHDMLKSLLDQFDEVRFLSFKSVLF